MHICNTFYYIYLQEICFNSLNCLAWDFKRFACKEGTECFLLYLLSISIAFFGFVVETSHKDTRYGCFVSAVSSYWISAYFDSLQKYYFRMFQSFPVRADLVTKWYKVCDPPSLNSWLCWDISDLIFSCGIWANTCPSSLTCASAMDLG